MPFKSEKQRKWMHANEPEMADKWEKEESLKGKLRNLIKQEINKLEAFRPKGVSYYKQMVFLPKSKLYFDPSNGNFWLMGPGGDPDWNDEPIEPKDRDYKRTLSRLSSKDKSIMKKSLRGSGNWKEATTTSSVPVYKTPDAFKKSTYKAIQVDDEDDSDELLGGMKDARKRMVKLDKESVNEGIKLRKGESVKPGMWEVFDNNTGKSIKVVKTASSATRLMNRLMNSGQYNEITTKWVGDSVDEAMSMAPFSSKEAKQHINQDIKKMSKHLGKASQQIIKIMMDGVKGGKYTAMDISRGIKEGPAGRAHFGELGFIQQLWNKVRDGFRRYSKDRKLS